MIILNVKQNSDDWRLIRCGIPTASRFDRIITPKTMKASASQDRLINELLAEWMLGEPTDDPGNDYMMRGHALEDEAANWYAMERDTDLVRAVGFCLRDDCLVGFSPDRFVGDNGGLEIKCPMPPGHTGYLRGDIGDAHRCQVQGSLWLSGREWWDVLSYHPYMPKALIRVERDEKFIGKLEECVAAFLDRLAGERERLTREYGVQDEITGIHQRIIKQYAIVA